MSEARAIFDHSILPLFEAAQPHWIERARITARHLCRKFGSCTINDVRRECPPPAGIDPRIMGAVFNRKDFEKIGHQNSVRRTCHGRPVGIFKLREAQ